MCNWLPHTSYHMLRGKIICPFCGDGENLLLRMIGGHWPMPDWRCTTCEHWFRVVLDISDIRVEKYIELEKMGPE